MYPATRILPPFHTACLFLKASYTWVSSSSFSNKWTWLMCDDIAHLYLGQGANALYWVGFMPGPWPMSSGGLQMPWSLRMLLAALFDRQYPYQCELLPKHKMRNANGTVRPFFLFMPGHPEGGSSSLVHTLQQLNHYRGLVPAGKLFFEIMKNCV